MKLKNPCTKDGQPCNLKGLVDNSYYVNYMHEKLRNSSIHFDCRDYDLQLMTTFLTIRIFVLFYTPKCTCHAFCILINHPSSHNNPPKQMIHAISNQCDPMCEAWGFTL